jgi:cyclophilin family peptidyl-prolyl cis-trans isomerase
MALRRCSWRFAKSYTSTVRTWMDVSIGGDAPRRIEFELFGKQCPTAVENFAKLCTGENVIPPVAAKEGASQPGFADQYLPQLTFKQSSFHRVHKGFLVQGGDIVTDKGHDQLSVFGDTFDAPDETKASVFNKAGLLGTAVSAPHLNGSQFFILTAKEGAPHLNGTCICFGRVSKGMDVVEEMQQLETSFDGRPLKEVRIVECGEQ